MRILTFNWHEAYICSLAKTGHQFEVIEQFKGGSSIWFYETRPVPPNVLIVKERDASERMLASHYDTVICHNINDFLWARNFDSPIILLFHNRLSTLLSLGKSGETMDNHRSKYRELIGEGTPPELVFISESKKRDWGFEGSVIIPGIDLEDYPHSYRGEEAKVLRVGNFMKSRDLMMGYSDQREILKNIPSLLLGLNENEADSRFTESWQDLKNCYSSLRLLLNATVDGFEDGYNLAMLEAMASGMPVVSTRNETSPIKDGVNGYISADNNYLREKILSLLDNQREALRLGTEGRNTVKEEFGIDNFTKRWNRVIERSAACKRAINRRAKAPLSTNAPRRQVSKNVLLAYVSYPVTTARYIERSLRKSCSVVSVGPAIGEEIIRAWKLENMKEPVTPHDIPCGNDVSISSISGELPPGWQPDLFLWVESVYGYFPGDISRLPCPTACYLIDSHLNLSWHLKWALNFDYVFLAQREFIPEFKKAGCPIVEWLPLACDPEVHCTGKVEKKHDIGFVGSVTSDHSRRKNLLDRLSKRGFNVHVERSFLKEMAKTFSSSKIVFNNAIKDDLNMRVFEAMASGSLLLTDRATGSGLEEFFIDGKNLVLFHDHEIEKKAEYFLENEDERERIAAAGKAEVLSKHTYDHRVEEMLSKVFPGYGDPTSLKPELKDALLKKALAYGEEKKFKEARISISYALNGRELTNDEWFELHCANGAACLNLNEYEEGRSSYEEAAKLKPESERPYLGMGAYYFNKGEHLLSVESYSRAIENNSKSVKAHCGLGISTYYGGKKKEGFQIFQSTLKVDPENQMALFYLIRGGYELEKFGAVEEALERYLELHPADTDMLFAMAGVLVKQKKQGAGKKRLDSILTLIPDHRDALDMKRMIESGSKKESLHGVTLELMITRLVSYLGWEELGQLININCFKIDPSVKSSLKFLRRTPWARSKVEKLYRRVIAENHDSFNTSL